MFIILTTYKKSLEVVDQYLAEHIRFLDQGYQKNFFVVSGRKKSSSGGIIFSQIKEYDRLMEIIKQDPFYINEIADYEIIEFIPRQYHQDFSKFMISAKH